MKYIKDAILREAPDVPTMVIKAVGRDYEEVTDRDELGVFLPQVQFIKAKPSKTKLKASKPSKGQAKIRRTKQIQANPQQNQASPSKN